jgi:hypothetical protein
MIVEVPICYYAYGRRAGKKVNVAHHFLESLRLDVPVFSGHEVPVVVEWDDRPEPRNMSNNEYWGSDDVAVGAEHVRALDGKFFRPLRFKDMGRPGDIDMIEVGKFIDAIPNGEVNGFLHLPKLQEGKRVPADVHFETVQGSGREAVVRPIREVASRLIVVDGTVYIRCEEPFICVWGANFAEVSRREPGAYWRGGVSRIVTAMPVPQALSPMELIPVQRFKEALTRTRRLNVANVRNKQALDERNVGQRPRLDADFYSDPDRLAASECRIQLRSFLHLISNRRDVILPLSDLRKLRLFTQLAGALDALPEDDAMQTVETAGTEWLDVYGAYNELHDPEESALRAAVEIAGSRPVHVVDIGRPGLRL